jgi:antitoxin component YwqK of YwqJK toxin-antitoxin module
MIKRTFFLLLAIAFIENVNAQAIASRLKGSIAKHGWSLREAPIKVLLNGISYSDSITLDQNSNSFEFKHIPYGIYELKIDANRGKTGLKDFIVEDILINKDSLELDTVFLFSVKTCGDESFVLGKKEPKEYYSTGELKGEGNYSIEKKYEPQFKTKLFSYKKNGLWKYYYKSGTLSSYAYYDKQRLDSIVEFYENGNVKSKGAYKYCKSGEWLYFGLAGEILFRVEFIDKFGYTPQMKVKYEYLKGYSQNYKMIER